MSNIITLRKISLAAAGSVLLAFGGFQVVQASSSTIFNSGVDNAAPDNNIVPVLLNSKNISITNILNGLDNSRRHYTCIRIGACG
ncbi:MAG: hypothetical protein PUP91_07415 [Rhizonema sp. PD37]|nr:hypothetical protein [Rhizonema sp. PD37]